MQLCGGKIKWFYGWGNVIKNNSMEKLKNSISYQDEKLAYSASRSSSSSTKIQMLSYIIRTTVQLRNMQYFHLSWEEGAGIEPASS